MRVVAGIAGGLRLASPEGTDTRPTPERVREATFNALGSMGAIEDATVLDLFAGSGAMGIEALSRGATHATFVERDRAARAVIEANLASTKLADRATVVGADATTYVGSAPRHYDLALCDPPYAFDAWLPLLAAMPADIVVIESGREIDLGGDWRVLRMKRYGSTVVTIADRPAPDEVDQ